MTARTRIDRHFAARSPRRQRLAALLHAAGPRPVLEALIEVADGAALDWVLERFARIPPATYHALGADRLAIDDVSIVSGGRA